MMLRLAWTFGLLSTREYSARTRLERFGPESADATEAALRRLERMLFQDRIAVVIFLIGLTILTYTAMNGPITPATL